MTIKNVGLLLIGISAAIFVLGQVNLYTELFSETLLGDLLSDNYANAWTELASIALTILVIDRLYERRGSEQEKQRLVLQMGSPNNAFALEAVRNLRNRNWLDDETVENAKLRGADLSNADLSDANLAGADLSSTSLQGAIFHRANLIGAIVHDADLSRADFSQAVIECIQLNNSNLSEAINLTNEQLATAHSLRHAKMVSGKPYNGRFNLDGDLLTAKLMRCSSSEKALAAFYEVTISNYKWGQEWHEFYLSSPTMYDPKLERWHEVNANPEGSYGQELIGFA